MVIGVDEVGRGPLAGPVTVGVVMCTQQTYGRLKRNRKLPTRGFDSKKLSAEMRQQYAETLEKLSEENIIQYEVVHVSHSIIDSKGLSFAIRKAMASCFSQLAIPETSIILLDGGLKAPEQFRKQKTIIRGDEKEKIISWASILAKVSRDKLMVRAAKKFPQYGFEVHKGYGTRSHREAILHSGLSAFHRKSFCKNLTKI